MAQPSFEHAQHVLETLHNTLEQHAPHVSPEERARETTIAQAHAIAEQYSIQIDTILDTEGDISCWASASETLVQDLPSLVTAVSGRFHGSRAYAARRRHDTARQEA